MKIKIENWTPESDIFLKKKEVEIHDHYHKALSEKDVTYSGIFSKHRRFRAEALGIAIEKANAKIKGKVLEVGAGDGWCSAYLLKNFSMIDHIHTMEINHSAVNNLIPKVLEAFEVDRNKSTLVLGSFNNIPLENHFDFVIAMGALHHSSNLYLTYKNIYKSLKPGGWLFAQEPAMPNDINNDYYILREKETITFKGLVDVKNSDRTDVFYRECEHRTAGYHAGFNFNAEKVTRAKEKSLIATIGSLFRKENPQKDSKSKPDNIIVYAQKPTTNWKEVPTTNWEEN